MRLAGIFNHHQPIGLCQLQDRVHVGYLAVEMHRHNGGHRTVAPLADRTSVGIPSALLLQILPEPLDGHVVGVLVDVDKLRNCSRLRNRLGGGNKRVGHGHHHVARLHSAGHDREAQSIRSAVDRNRMGCIAEFCKGALEIFDHGTADKAGREQSAAKYGGQFFFKFHVRSYQVQKRNITGCVHGGPHDFLSI